MRLSAAAWSFVGTTLHESARMWRALGIDAIDLLASPGSLVDANQIVENPIVHARQMKATGSDLSNLIFFPGPWFDNPPTNTKDPEVRKRLKNVYARVFEFCNEASIPSVIISPGIDLSGSTHEESQALSIDVLNSLSIQAATNGITLMFEPHVGSVMESPIETLACLQANPDLRIVLDYSHFLVQGYIQQEVDPLAPFCAHVHLRQATRGHIQTRWEDGTIDIENEISLLRKHGYSGFLALEYEFDPTWLKMDEVDVVTESIKMRNAVRPLI